MRNFVPLPYRRVAVRDVDFALTEQALQANLLGREAYRRTEFIVLRRGRECAIARVEREKPDELFSAITSVELFAPPAECRITYDPTVDVGIPSQLAAKARALNIGDSATLIVHGKYEHVNFIYHPQPVVVRVVDVIPPEPGKLWTMAQQVLTYAEELPAIELRFEPIDLIALARNHPAPAYLFPCQASGIEVGAPLYFLDTRPPLQAWTMIGCERCAQLHRHFYEREPEQVDFCPRKLAKADRSVPQDSFRATPVPSDGTDVASAQSELLLTKCCLLETTVECEGNRAVVPWGATLRHVEEALRYLASRAEPKLIAHAPPLEIVNDC